MLSHKQWMEVTEPPPCPAGGRQGKLPVTALEALDLEVNSWTRYPCIPSRRAFSCCASSGRSLFSLGGLQQPGPHNFYSRPHFVNTMEEYDLDQGKEYNWYKKVFQCRTWCHHRNTEPKQVNIRVLYFFNIAISTKYFT